MRADFFWAWTRFLALALLLGGALLWWTTPLPQEVRERSLGSDRILEGSDGEIVQVLRTDWQKRRLPWHGLQRFSPELRAAVILAEDRRFDSHVGVDPVGLLRAVRSLWTAGRPQGASTITMQLSDLIQKEVILSSSPIRKRSWMRKIVQALRAIGLEWRWRKQDILEAYLNLIHLRSEYQGVPVFAHAYFGKHPEALNRAESLVIATLISSPNRPWPSVLERACRLSQRAGWRAECALIGPLVDQLAHRRPLLVQGPNLAPHVARRLLGEAPAQSIIRSTVDRSLQERVVSILERNMRRLSGFNVQDSAALVVDNETGRVRAYVGAVTTSRSPDVDGVRGLRQAGSTLKPFLYAKALEMRTLTPASVLRDEATVISWSGGVYRPLNYDRQFYGPVSVREALGSSLNVPAVKLVTILGLHTTYGVLQTLGLTGLKEPDFYGVSVALGAVDVRLEELVNAYRALARGGVWSPLVFREGESSHERQVFSPDASFLVASILSDPHARAIGFNWENPLTTPFWTAVKTGTSKDHRDNWCVGFSSRYTVGVWVGNFDAQAMRGVSGVAGAGPAWFEIMNELHRNLRSEPPTPPANIVTKWVRQPWWAQSRREYFIAGTEPEFTSVEVSPQHRIEFVFPTEGSVLRLNPHWESRRQALFIRYAGKIPPRSRLFLNGRDMARARSPWVWRNPKPGTHALELRSREGSLLAAVRFRIQ